MTDVNKMIEEGLDQPLTKHVWTVTEVPLDVQLAEPNDFANLPWEDAFESEKAACQSIVDKITAFKQVLENNGADTTHLPDKVHFIRTSREGTVVSKVEYLAIFIVHKTKLVEQPSIIQLN